jgi:hypothetical protein
MKPQWIMTVLLPPNQPTGKAAPTSNPLTINTNIPNPIELQLISMTLSPSLLISTAWRCVQLSMEILCLGLLVVEPKVQGSNHFTIKNTFPLSAMLRASKAKSLGVQI